MKKVTCICVGYLKDVMADLGTLEDGASYPLETVVESVNNFLGTKWTARNYRTILGPFMRLVHVTDHTKNGDIL